MTTPQEPAPSVYQRFGIEMFPTLSPELFTEVLVHAAFSQFEEKRFRYADMGGVPEGLRIPRAFVNLHKGKLHFWEGLTMESEGCATDDVTYLGAVHHTQLKCGVMLAYSDLGGVYHSIPFEYQDDHLPEQHLANLVLDFLGSEECEAVELTGSLTNHAPDLIPKAWLKKHFNETQDYMQENQFEEFFAEVYHEKKRRVRKSVKKTPPAA